MKRTTVQWKLVEHIMGIHGSAPVNFYTTEDGTWLADTGNILMSTKLMLNILAKLEQLKNDTNCN